MNRRDFFEKIAAAGALVAISPSVLASEETKALAPAEKVLPKPKKPKRTIFHPLNDVSVLQRFDDEKNIWVDIGYVNAIDLTPSPVIDITSVDSYHGYREFIQNHRKSSELNIDVVFSKSTWEIIKSDFADNKQKSYAIIPPFGNALEFEGHITEVPLNVPVNDMLGCSMTFTIIGSVDYYNRKKYGL